MRHPWTERLKSRIRPLLFKFFKGGRESFFCPICNYRGPFKDKKIDAAKGIVRVDSKCPSCTSTERHRMLHLVLCELFSDWDGQSKSILHVAPEDCLKPMLTKHFSRYETSDLHRKDVDHNEDLQKMSFADDSYDCILVSRVLTIPPDLEACVHECRRVVRPGGIAIIAEIYKHNETQEFGEMINGRSREMGIDALELYRAHFPSVDLYLSDRYPPKNQLINNMVINGSPEDNYPDQVKVPGKGFMDLVAICHC